MTILQATVNLKEKLGEIYEDSEAAQIATWIMEALTGKGKAEQRLYAELELNKEQQILWRYYLDELMQNRPVQYVLGESYFYGLKLYVDENVLIPRPETEELVEWAVNSITENTAIKHPLVLDIGTGSGCIAIAIKNTLAEAKVYAMDVDKGALSVAKKNAGLCNTEIHFVESDILDSSSAEHLPVFDYIISNPPYITQEEKETILPNVLQYEPHKALFVTNNDPLQFYKAIEKFARRHLRERGLLFLELHRDFAVQAKEYFLDSGWNCTMRKDMQDNLRMICCEKGVL